MHPDTHELLKLKDERLMDRDYSYVNSQGSYPIRYDILKPYKPEEPADVWVLEEESYRKVTRGRDYARLHGDRWRRGGDETPPPLPEPLRERQEEGKRAAMMHGNSETSTVEGKIWRECYEALMGNFLAPDDPLGPLMETFVYEPVEPSV